MSNPFKPPSCKWCGAQIHWTKMVDTRASLALNPTPSSAGSIRLVRDGKWGEFLSVELRRQAALAAGAELYEPHWMTCPRADDWRPEKPR